MALTSRSKLSGIAAAARRMRAAGWSVQSIARLYRVTRADVLAILRPRPTRLPRPAPQPKPIDSWKGTWRYREDVGPAELPSRPAVDQVELDTSARISAAAPPPEPWKGPAHPCATVRTKLTREKLSEARRLRVLGWTWPAIARRLGVHRMTIYHAMRRPPL